MLSFQNPPAQPVAKPNSITVSCPSSSSWKFCWLTAQNPHFSVRDLLRYEVNFLQVIAPSVRKHWEFFTFAQVPTCRLLAPDLLRTPAQAIEFVLTLLRKAGLELPVGDFKRFLGFHSSLRCLDEPVCRRSSFIFT